ncbi:hypothetical protein GEMRC1_005139 [Eukaryota sp. GEM-RC1]
MPTANSSQDLNSLGYFSAPILNSTNDPYDKKEKLDSRYKGTQMKTACVKKGKTNDTTFEPFKSLYTNEPYVEMETIARRERLNQSKKAIVKEPFRPSSPAKKATGPGLISPAFGTLGTFKYEPETAPKVDRTNIKHEPRNFYTSPSKKGTGYSYSGVTIGKAPEYTPEPVTDANNLRKTERELEQKKRVDSKPFVSTSHSTPCFDKNNSFKYEPGAFASPKTAKKTEKALKPFVPSSPSKCGLVGGTFSPFPEYKGPGAEPKGPRQKTVLNTPVFRPTSCPKSTVTRSIAFYRMK